MTRQNRFGTVLGAIAILAVTARPAWSGDQQPPAAKGPKAERPRVALDYQRDPKAARRGDVSPQQVPDVPDDLKVAPPVAASRSAAPGPAVRAGKTLDIEGLGTQSGEKMATEAAREWGWRQYWRAGFHRGMRDALSDPRPGTWDHEEGLRYGRLDPRAFALGGEIARDAAQDAAERAAGDRVREQYSDLSREPRRSPAAPSRPGDAGRWIPAAAWAAAPVYDDVFVALPLAATPGLDRDARAALDGWNVQPAVLARDAQTSRAYDAAWKDAAYAFSVWRDRQRPGSYWSRFGPGERDRFRTAFFARFDEVMGSIDLRPTYAGYRVGYADGWRYGAAVNAEWHYRLGYAEGFDLGVRAAAALAFPFLFDKAYAAAYDAEFSRWANNAVPALGALRWVEGDDNGVIEPGESVQLTGEVVNYGGASGTFEIRAESPALEAAGTGTVRLPARGRFELRPVALRVGERTAPRTRAAVAVTIGDDRVELPLYVSRPLEIDGDPVIEADRLAGRVRVAVTVANRSRRDLDAEARFSDPDGRSRGERTDRAAIPAGGAATLEAEYDGLRPLDLIAGNVRWQATVRHEATEDDTRSIAMTPASTDLSDPDLLTYTLDLARTRRPAPRDVSEARALMLDRMRADWDRACAMDGNPYKRDLEEGSASTALGELVRQVNAGRGSFVAREVFGGLGADIAALAEDLPGAHPMLRKWMKRLAKRVG